MFSFAKDGMRLVPVSERHRPAVRNVWWHQTALPGLARRMQLDVLHVPSYRRMVWRRPCAVTATIHDLAPFHVQGKYDPARMFYGRVVVRRLARRQDAIIAVSQNTARDIKRFFGVPSPRVRMQSPMELITAAFVLEMPRPRNAPCVTDGDWHSPFFSTCLGSSTPGKNHVRLIHAFEQLKAETQSSWILAFAGSDWHGAEAVRAASEQSSARRDIRFLGFVEDSWLPTLYRAAGAFVYPSLFEGFGFPPIEAMACACPVLSSARGSLGEVVGDAALIIDPESATNIRDGLGELAGNPAIRERLRRAGLSNAARFNWDTNAAAVLEVWRSTRPSAYLTVT